MWVYIALTYGNPNSPLEMKAAFARKYRLFPNEIPNERGFIFPMLDKQEREMLRSLFYSELANYKKGDFEPQTPLEVLNDYVKFCLLLAKPENHIRVASGNYFEKAVNTRPVHDMTNEMAQKLTKLPQFTAYAKVIEEKGGEQLVSRHKMETFPLPRAPEYDANDLAWKMLTSFPIETNKRTIRIVNDSENWIIKNTNSLYCKKREEIESEIRQRKEKWRGSISDEAPPTHA